MQVFLSRDQSTTDNNETEHEQVFSSDEQLNSNSNVSGNMSEAEPSTSTGRKATRRRGADELLEELLMVADDELLGRVLKKRKQQTERGRIVLANHNRVSCDRTLDANQGKPDQVFRALKNALTQARSDTTVYAGTCDGNLPDDEVTGEKT